MTIELQTLPRFTFPSQSGGPRSQIQILSFPTTVVRSVVAAINGFKIGFTSSDHELFQKEVDASAVIITGDNGLEVWIRVNFALRDSSGVFDDPYEGFVDVVLIMDRD